MKPLLKMSESHAEFEKIGNQLADSTAGKLFGKPCFKIGGKAFICFFKDALVCKLKDDHHKSALNLKGSQQFDPSGKKRPMKEWVQIPFTHKKVWKKYATSALKYVQENL